MSTNSGIVKQEITDNPGSNMNYSHQNLGLPNSIDKSLNSFGAKSYDNDLTAAPMPISATEYNRMSDSDSVSTSTTSKPALKKRKRETSASNNESNENNSKKSSNNNNNNNNNNNGPHSNHSSAGHRPVTSCTHCRQHKIKCNASEKFPEPCSRCARMNLKCEIDPQFRPKKGSQIQSLRNDVDELRSKIEFLTRNENLMAQVLQNSPNFIMKDNEGLNLNGNTNPPSNFSRVSPSSVAKTVLTKEPVLLSLDGNSSTTPLLNDSATNKTDLNPALEAAVRNVTESPAQFVKSLPQSLTSSPTSNHHNSPRNHRTNSNQKDQVIGNNTFKGKQLTTPVNTKHMTQDVTANAHITEFILGDVKINIEKAETLHQRFINNYLPYLPIMISNSPVELYQQSQLLFWTVMLTACLSDPEPGLYNSFASLIKQLAIETCWIRTPRSTHIVQSLLILGTWPLPNQKVLDDCSYRFIGLAKSLSLQLGLHRGEFMTEFTRTQVALPDAEKWRSRTWLAVFFCEQFWSSNLGLPPSLQTDYLLERARIDQSLPKNFRCLISLSIFQAKLVNIMGLNVSGPDGLMDPSNRSVPLHILERELERLAFKLQIDDLVVECYYLYVKLMVCLFAFLPETPSEDQTKYVTVAYYAATRIVTILPKLLENRQLTELPIYVRHSVTTAAFVLFRLHLTPYLVPKYIDSSRQSIVTVHRLYRNMLAAWRNVENDISRTATVLEKLNFVILTHPGLFTDTEGIIVRMRSHLTGSLFYDLVWNIHESRRRSIEENKNGSNDSNNGTSAIKPRKALPLPFYNQITKDDFTAITTTTPNGTTVTTLVPTDQAINNAKASATRAGLAKPTEINGIPLAMLEATGSLVSKQTEASDNNLGNKKQRSSANLKKKSTVKSNNIARNTTKPLNVQRSTSMNAALNGLVPPPLFPNNNLRSTSAIPTPSPAEVTPSKNTAAFNPNIQNHASNNSHSNRYDEYLNPPRRATMDTPINLSGSSFNNTSNSNHNGTPLDRNGITPVNISGLDNLFESPSMPISINASPGEEAGKSLSQRSSSTAPVLTDSGHRSVEMSVSNSRSNSSNAINNSNGSNGETGVSAAVIGSTSQSPTDSADVFNEMFIDSIFQQNLSKHNEEDDLLGWFDMNMAPEF